MLEHTQNRVAGLILAGKLDDALLDFAELAITPLEQTNALFVSLQRIRVELPSVLIEKSVTVYKCFSGYNLG